MPKFREARRQLLFAYDDKIISDEEFLLSYDINTSKNLDYDYWNYAPFNLEGISEEECCSEFRFQKADIYRLKDALRIPDTITCNFYNDTVFHGVEALCILLRRLSYPTRYSDIIPRFARPVPQICMAFNHILDLIDNRWNQLLSNLNQPWL